MVPGGKALLAGGEPPREPAERDHGDTLRGWQRAAAACLNKSACASLYSDLDPASRALHDAVPSRPRWLARHHGASHSTRVPDAKLAHAGAFVAAPPPAPASGASHLQVRWRSGRAARMGSGARLPRSRRKGGLKCDGSGHEPRCACHGRAPHRGAGERPAAVAGCASHR